MFASIALRCGVPCFAISPLSSSLVLTSHITILVFVSVKS